MYKNSYNSRQNNSYNENYNYNQNNQSYNYNSNPQTNNYREQYVPNMNNISNISNTNSEFKPKSYNGIFIALLTILYILFINKIAEMLSSSNSDDESKISSYVMMVYFISIMGLVIGYIWMTEQNNGNYVLRKSLTYGGITMLIYTILNYWEYLDDYAKLIMLALSISCIVYYAY
jgi:hypothetical protein